MRTKTDKTNKIVVKNIRPYLPITKAKMLGKFLKLGTSKIVTLISVTYPKLNEKSRVDNSIKNTFGRISKHAETNGFVGVDYENCVNNQLAREGKTADFEAVKPTFGVKVVVNGKTNRVIEDHIKKDGEYQQYIAFNHRATVKSEYRNENNEVVDYETIKDFLPKPSDKSRQGTDKKIIWNKFKVESIIGFRTDGVEYRIVG